jgi:hypothetical protein
MALDFVLFVAQALAPAPQKGQSRDKFLVFSVFPDRNKRQ